MIYIFLCNSIIANDNKKKFVIGQHNCGFFSIFLGTLNKLLWTKEKNKIPVVYWGKDCLYYQKSGYNGAFNVWEYYFEQVSNLHYKKGDIVYTNYPAPNGFSIPYQRGCYDDKFHKKLKYKINNLIKEYVKIKPPVRKKIHSFYAEKMKGKINIGIHLRGTDKKKETLIEINPKIILNKANEIAKNIKTNYQFFVATDEERLLKLAKSMLKGDVVYYDSHRSNDGIPIHYARKNPAISGEEILIEAKLLSKCDMFLHTRSNVASAVMFFNPNIKNIFFVN